jgi:hypothetical protein
MKIEDLAKLPAIARELRAAGVLQLKCEGIELTLMADLPDPPRTNLDDEPGEGRKPIAPPAFMSALDVMQGRGGVNGS